MKNPDYTIFTFERLAEMQTIIVEMIITLEPFSYR